MGVIKPYTWQAQRELKNRKQKEHKTENNEAEISMLVEQDRRLKRQKSNDNRNNECIICRKKLLEKTVNFTDSLALIAGFNPGWTWVLAGF